MKLIIAGSRTLNVSANFIDEIISLNNIYVAEVVSGGARGIDAAGEEWARFNNHNVPVVLISSQKARSRVSFKVFEADWEEHGKAAGPIRNKQMAEYADALLLIWDGQSKGSTNMKHEMEKLKKPIYEVIIK